jgi:hypothetical protein
VRARQLEPEVLDPCPEQRLTLRTESRLGPVAGIGLGTLVEGGRRWRDLGEGGGHGWGRTLTRRGQVLLPVRRRLLRARTGLG